MHKSFEISYNWSLQSFNSTSATAVTIKFQRIIVVEVDPIVVLETFFQKCKKDDQVGAIKLAELIATKYSVGMSKWPTPETLDEEEDRFGRLFYNIHKKRIKTK